MKSFSLEAALAGEPVITLDGEVVADLHLFDVATAYPLYGVVEGTVTSFTKEGLYDEGLPKHHHTLFMAPKKRTVWVNFYADSQSGYYHKSEEVANHQGSSGRVGGKAYPVEIED